MTDTVFTRDEFQLEVAYAVGEGVDIVDHLTQLHESRGWSR